MQFPGVSIMTRRITKEDIAFLEKLQRELNSQPTLGTADPRFWVVLQDKWVETGKGRECERITYYNGDACEEVAHIDPEYEDVAEPFAEYCDFIPIYEHCVETIVPDTLFLTLRECEEHIEANRHHYSNPRPFCMCAWRSPQVEKLVEILHEVDFARARSRRPLGGRKDRAGFWGRVRERERA